MATTALATYSLWPGFSGIIALAVTFACVNLPCIAVWALAGERLRAVLTHAGADAGIQRGDGAAAAGHPLPVLRG